MFILETRVRLPAAEFLPLQPPLNLQGLAAARPQRWKREEWIGRNPEQSEGADAALLEYYCTLCGEHSRARATALACSVSAPAF